MFWTFVLILHWECYLLFSFFKEFHNDGATRGGTGATFQFSSFQAGGGGAKRPKKIFEVSGGGAAKRPKKNFPQSLVMSLEKVS